MRSLYHPSSRRSLLLASGLIFSILVLAACQPAAVNTPAPAASQPAAAGTSAPALPATGPTAAAPTAAPTEAPTAAPSATAVPGPSISVANDPTYGQILVGDNGMTLYAFTKDGPDQSNCNASCLEKWPPLQTQGNPTLGAGVDASMVGAAALADGTQIVTYNHMPLYYWYQDAKPGDTNGQGVSEVWYVVSPAGTMVQTSLSTPTVAPGPVVNIANDSQYGQILVDGNGFALYVFAKDGADQSNCEASCLEKWPPLQTQGSPTAGEGVDASLLGYTTLADGSLIVTYDHKPLYYWYQDSKAGDTQGEGVGNVWFLVSPAGAQVKGPLAQSKPTKSSGGSKSTY